MANEVARDSAKKAQQLPASTQFAIVTALPNITNGAFWGFTDVEKAREHSEALKSDKNIQARKLGNACLIEVNPDYLIKAVSMINKDLVTQKDIDNMLKGRADAEVAFEKFLIKKGEKGAFEGLVGIYCTNDSTAITYKGTSYPAFRLSIQKVLELCNQWGYMIKVKGQYVTPAVAMQSGAALFESMILSPTNTGIFIEIKSTLAPQQIKQMSAQKFPKAGKRK